MRREEEELGRESRSDAEVVGWEVGLVWWKVVRKRCRGSDMSDEEE